jgi:O-antigen ligase/polysaccharide polymerase Wzy-like membrane protein
MSSLEPAAPPTATGAISSAGRRQLGATAATGWRYAIVALVLTIWLIPIRRYRLPVELPFNLEPYRIMVFVLAGLLVLSVVTGRMRLSASGHGKALFLLAVAAVAAQLVNSHRISEAGLSTPALKSLSYFLSMLLVFLIVSSVLWSRQDVDAVVIALALGAAVVALAALYEARVHVNVFNYLDNWIPGLEQTGEDRYNYRGGRLRVRASAQHPIALGAALIMSVPLVLYLARRATGLRRGLWLLVTLLIAAGAVGTVSRTVVLMLAAMLLVALVLRPRQLVRLAPLLLVLAVLAQLAAPGSVRQLYRAFTPKEGLVSEQSTRAGFGGSGRIADLEPGVQEWRERPIFGRGLGTGASTAEPAALDALDEAIAARIIFDNEYLGALVALGAFGMIALLWFMWGSVVKLALSARQLVDLTGDFLAACAATTTGFTVGMLSYDAFAFPQVTFLFCVVAALGLKARALARP